MTRFEDILPDLRGVLAMLTQAREAAWLGQTAEQHAFLDRKIAALRARIAHLERLPQRDDPPTEP
jgi:hypothetical protein